MRPSAISPHGGYQKLKSFQNTKSIYDLTVEFCRRYVSPNRADRPDKSYTTHKTYRSYRTADQMVQAARSGKQNIAEGSKRSGVSKKSEFELMSVARSSLQELLEDYKDFLRQNKLKLWDKNDELVKQMRQIVYRANRTDESDKTKRTDKTYTTYVSYMDDAEAGANMLITLINQTNYLLDRQLAVLANDVSLSQNDLIQAGRKRTAQAERGIKKTIQQDQELVRLEDGRFISKTQYRTLKNQGQEPMLFPGWEPPEHK